MSSEHWKTAEIIALEQHIIKDLGIDSWLLMSEAASELADFTKTAPFGPSPGPITAICGPGNNGGDAALAGAMLAETGHEVIVFYPLGFPHLGASREAQLAFSRLSASPGIRHEGYPAPSILNSSKVILDGLFGIGLSRGIAPTSELGVLIGAINQSKCPVISVDSPSGLDCDTGLARGACIKATITITFFGQKAGFNLNQGADHCGEIVVADIGVSTEYAHDWLTRQRN